MMMGGGGCERAVDGKSGVDFFCKVYKVTHSGFEPGNVASREPAITTRPKLA